MNENAKTLFYADTKCKCIEEHEPEHTYTFKGKWVWSRQEHSVTVKAEDLFKYRNGEKIQNAFPYLSPKDREFLISGDWFPDPDDPGEDYF